MKLLKDLIVARKEFHQIDSNLSWGMDGTLYMSSTSESTVGCPIYTRDMNRSSKKLFYVKKQLYQVDNKLEHDRSRENIILNSDPEGYIKIFKPCPSNGDILATLTNNGNVIIYENDEPILNLDQSDKIIEQRTYHCLSWNKEGTKLAVGNEDNQVIIFDINLEDKSYIALNIDMSDDNDWVTRLDWNEDGLIASTSSSTVYYMTFTDDEEITPKKILDPSRFKIEDILIINNFILITAHSHIYKYDVVNDSMVSQIIDPIFSYKLIPVFKRDEVILLSGRDSQMIKLKDTELILYPDDIITPILTKRISRWNEFYNQSKKFEIMITIYGISLSPDQYTVAIMYRIERISFKFLIQSQEKRNIMFIPLYDDWKLSTNATGLAWYQTYNMYGKKLPITTDIIDSSIDTSLSFIDYLREMIKDESINKSMFENIIKPDELSLTLFRKTLLKYAEAHKEKINNDLDKLCITSLSDVINNENVLDIESDEIISMQGEFIKQNFNIKGNCNPMIITSKENIPWRRCSLTLLPLLTTNSKVCPVSKERIIDISKDTINEYGWFTRTLLEFFRNKSPFTGGTFGSPV